MAPNLTKQENKNKKYNASNSTPDQERVLRLPPPLKTGRLDIGEILLKVALKHQKSINQSINPFRGKNNLPL
jgi:valyl-tRNA synthetase